MYKCTYTVKTEHSYMLFSGLISMTDELDQIRSEEVNSSSISSKAVKSRDCLCSLRNVPNSCFDFYLIDYNKTLLHSILRITYYCYFIFLFFKTICRRTITNYE